MDRSEAEVLDECKRLGIKNDPKPNECPTCKTDKFFKYVPGMVGESMLMCTKCNDIIWTDNVDAIRRVL